MTWNASKIENKIGLRFKKNQLLKLALIHPSYAQQINQPDDDNERLAVLGKEILNLATINYLYHNCHYLSTKKWSQLQEKLISDEKLTKVWFNLGLGEAYPFLGLKDDRYTLRKKRNNPFDDALEALVGAIYLDRDFSQSQTWINKKLISPLLENHLKQNQERINPEKQLEFLGSTLLQTITVDAIYRYLPYINPKYITNLSKKIQSKTQQNNYFKKLSDDDWNLINIDLKSYIKKSFKSFLAAVYLQYSLKTNKFLLRQTREWFFKKFIDEDELLKDAITLLLKDEKPQKWIIHNVMGYESKKYNEGRERFHELMDEKPIKS